MKNLDLNIYGVEEMNLAQMQGIEGGNWVRTVMKVAEYIGLADMVAEFCEGFTEGAQEGYTAQQTK